MRVGFMRHIDAMSQQTAIPALTAPWSAKDQQKTPEDDMEKRVRDLAPDDKIVSDDAGILTLKKITPGWSVGTFFLEWKEPVKPCWSCLHGSMIVTTQ